MTGESRRCLPRASADLQAQLVDAVTASAATYASASATSLAAHFAGPSQRLQRYIADIRKGFSIIIAAGDSPQLCASHGLQRRCFASTRFGRPPRTAPAVSQTQRLHM